MNNPRMQWAQTKGLSDTAYAAIEYVSTIYALFWYNKIDSVIAKPDTS